MKHSALIPQKIVDRDGLLKRARQWRVTGKKIAFTNGVFDLVHKGHLQSLSDAAKEADYFVVGINSDRSVKKLKGESRPIQDEQTRALIVASLVIVDAVVLFDEDTPIQLIVELMPDVLVKGGDYTIDQIVGAKEVQQAGGRVVTKPILEGHSTSLIIEKLKSSAG